MIIFARNIFLHTARTIRWKVGTGQICCIQERILLCKNRPNLHKKGSDRGQNCGKVDITFFFAFSSSLAAALRWVGERCSGFIQREDRKVTICGQISVFTSSLIITIGLPKLIGTSASLQKMQGVQKMLGGSVNPLEFRVIEQLV